MAPVNIFDLWQSIMSEVNVQQGGQIRPQTDFQNWLNAINMEMFHEWVAEFQLNQQNADELAPFLMSVFVPVTPVAGQPYDLIPFPATYAGFSNCRVQRQKDSPTGCACEGDLPILDKDRECIRMEDPDYAAMVAQFAGSNLTEKIVQLIDNQKWEGCLDHVTKAPTYDKPKITQFSGGFKIAPKGIPIVTLDFFRLPRAAIFAYTIGAGDIVVYDSAGSQQLEWPNSVKNEILIRLKKKYGIYVQDELMYTASVTDQKALV